MPCFGNVWPLVQLMGMLVRLPRPLLWSDIPVPLGYYTQWPTRCEEIPIFVSNFPLFEKCTRKRPAYISCLLSHCKDGSRAMRHLKYLCKDGLRLMALKATAQSGWHFWNLTVITVFRPLLGTCAWNTWVKALRRGGGWYAEEISTLFDPQNNLCSC